MKNIVNIYIVLGFCVYLILSSIMFLICKDIILHFDKRKSIKSKEKYESMILKHLNYIENNKSVSPIEINSIKDLIRKKYGIKIVSDVLIDFNKEKSKYDITIKYITNFEDDIVWHIKRCKRKDDIVKNHIVFLLGEYRITNYEINEFLFECLSTKSMYLMISSLRAIAKMGNANNLIKALKLVSKEDKFINSKILNDILDEYSGESKELNIMMDSYYSFNEFIQKSMIEHFKNNKNELVKDRLLKLLNEDISKEIKISIIKYFGQVKSKDAKYIIIQILQQNDWEYRAICAKSLSIYKDDDSKKAILKSIKDKNWYVRYNSAMCLLEFEDEVLVKSVIEGNDKYAIDILFYALFMKNKITNEEYIKLSKEIEVNSYA